MPGDTNRRNRTTSGTITNSAASSVEIVMVNQSGADSGVYAGGVVQIPANSIGTCNWYAKAKSDSTPALLYDTSGTAVTTTIAAGGGVYPLPYAASFGAYSVIPVAGTTGGVTIVAGMLT
ncbi:MAG: hypothetical protein QM811_06980 [Pirellulales bacterium]